MKIRLRPLHEQVVVITGASSGIGLATAREATRRGARVVLVGRDGDALARVADELRAEGGDAVHAEADVADAAALRAAAELAVRTYGRIDTWISNAGVSIYGRLEDTPLEDARRVFETNYWGVVHGAMAALPHLKANGGALITIGSIASDRAIPLQGHYSASKHAVKGFTDALRVELEKEGAPVQVTLVKPGAIDTPYPRHARNLLPHEPRNPPPVYAPEVVADAILFCAAHPRRSVTVGGGGRLLGMMGMMGMMAPRLADRMFAATMFEGQQREEPTRPGRRDALYQPPRTAGDTRGDHPGHVSRSSLYTAASLRPGRTLLAVAAVGVGVALAANAGSFRAAPAPN